MENHSSAERGAAEAASLQGQQHDGDADTSESSQLQQQSSVGGTYCIPAGSQEENATSSNLDIDDPEDDDEWKTIAEGDLCTIDADEGEDESPEKRLQRRAEEVKAEKELGLVKGCVHYDRLCQIVAPCWYVYSIGFPTIEGIKGGTMALVSFLFASVEKFFGVDIVITMCRMWVRQTKASNAYSEYGVL